MSEKAEREILMAMRRMLAAALVMAMGIGVAARASDFVKPTAEELSMTSVPGFPGASAVVLFREEITNDDLHSVEHYDRIKILTKEGEKYANVELPFVSTTGSYNDTGDEKQLSQIQGRTIHSDGTVIPFTGKPYLKVIEKGKNSQYQEKIFTLPDVEVGSIIEYRYMTYIADRMYESPSWFIQGDLYLKAAHYVWYPTEKDLIDNKQRPINTITWFPILPDGVTIQHHDLPHGSAFTQGPVQYFDLTVKDVPPQAKEKYMPPIASYSYRVLFNFKATHTADEWWKEEGHDWSKNMDSFTNPNSEMKSATEKVIAGATTDDQKLKKIYAAVMALENNRFTRVREDKEDKAQGEGKLKNASDVLAHGRGNATQLTEVFVGMTRAAGLKAYFMLVPDRSKEIFTQSWLSFNQFDDVIAIVNLDGREAFFDPGCRYCAYGHLAWEHTFVQGLRQVDKGTEFAVTSGEQYTANQTQRVANLKMDEKGEITGTIKLTFIGASAVGWRHTALSGDEESLKHGLKTHLEEMVPKSLAVTVNQIDGLQDYEGPLVVQYQVTGSIGTPTGKRLVMPSDLFESGSSATFADEKREQAVYFHYPRLTSDALRISFPKGYSVEAVPTAAKYNLPNQEAYTVAVTSDETSFTLRRVHAQNEIIVLPKSYDELRKFYSQFESKDQESVVLKMAPVTTASSTPGGN
jgi:hypothetical protein